MKSASPFSIREFTNPSGKIVFQLYARLDGKRFRKNFPTRAEAERQVQEVQWLQQDGAWQSTVGSGVRSSGDTHPAEPTPSPTPQP